MGFRSTFVTEDRPVSWPAWFVEKYRRIAWFRFKDGHSGVIASRMEVKEYGDPCSDLAEDIRRAIDWDGFGKRDFILVYLHECGGITRVQIERDGVRYSVPSGWEEVDRMGHNYCYGCSDLPIEPPNEEGHCK